MIGTEVGRGVGINIPLTWALVGGHMGLPTLGLAGAGWAAFLSGCLGTAIMAAHFHLTAEHAPYRIPSRLHKEALLEQLREGVPMGIQYFFEGGAVDWAAGCNSLSRQSGGP